MARLTVLGAEAQAATSIALAYPDRAVLFVAERRIIDGGDLPNVEIALSSPCEVLRSDASGDDVVALSAKWMQASSASSLSEVLGRVEASFPNVALPVRAEPDTSGRWIVKGDRFHRPDHPLSGTAPELSDVTDPNGCGVRFQAWCESNETIMVIGRRDAPGAVVLGAVRVLDERFFWDDVLQAGETVEAPEIVSISLAVLDAIDHQGFFTLNWLVTESGARLSSFRPVPRAVFQAFRCGGADLIGPTTKVAVARAGIRFVANPHYAALARPT